MADRTNPWAELRRRRHITLKLDRIAEIAGGGFYYRRGDRALIVIDPQLSQRDRRAVLMHELVHDEWGGTDCARRSTSTMWKPVMVREEIRVDREVASRLVPVDELEQLVATIEDLGGGVQAADVADHFDVPEVVATTAMEQLVERRRRSA